LKRAELNVSKVNEVFAHNHTEIVGKKPANNCNNTDMHKAHLAAVIDIEEGEISANPNTVPVLKDLSGLNDTSEVHASGDPSKLKLTLHNSFELLEDDEDNIAGEARPSDGELPFIAIEEDMHIRDNGMEVTIEKANLLHPIASKVPCNLVIIPSQSSAFSPIKMATPITNYEQLGPDKSKVKLPSSSKNLSDATIKS